jgi:vacuolar protein sorting-associated protein 72
MQEEEEMRQYQRSRKSAARKKPQRKLTQREMFEEAKKTERENLASLEAYTLLEAEKRRVKEKKTGIQGPFVRFHSITMPAITELRDPTSDASRPDTQNNQETVINSSSTSDGAMIVDPSVTQNQTAINAQSSVQPASTERAEPQQRYCRNFLVFTDTVNFPGAFFPTTKPQKPRRKFCPVTGLPARYVDPITGTPYATSQAFRIIRNKYINEGEQKCEKRLLQLSNWLEEKKRKKLESKVY